MGKKIPSEIVNDDFCKTIDLWLIYGDVQTFRAYSTIGVNQISFHHTRAYNYWPYADTVQDRMSSLIG